MNDGVSGCIASKRRGRFQSSSFALAHWFVISIVWRVDGTKYATALVLTKSGENSVHLQYAAIQMTQMLLADSAKDTHTIN